MKLRLYIVFFLLLAFTSLQAQIIRCATTELHKMKMEQDPQYRAYYQNIAEKMKAWAAQGAQERTTGTQVITIPVVVHVLWNTNAQNISDAQIHSQIDVLNQDFGGANADQSQIPAPFKGVFGNAQLNFCMATRTSNGDWTTGIERRQTSTTSFAFGDASIKNYAQGGLTGWDRSKYLNIWICNLSGGLLGYTEMPGGDAADDGVVILYSAFGKGYPGLISQYNLGRTATHEIGHWLGLYHVWGDDGGACTGTDYIEDTPNQSNYTYGCPSFPLIDACSSSPQPNAGDPVNGVMFMNYLDYSDDDCMHMFTTDQVAVMRSILNTTRSTILTSNGCSTPTGIADINAASYINVYPNPASSAIHIDFLLPSATVVSIKAYDMLGNEMITSEIHRMGQQNITLDVSALNTGLYMLVVNTDQGKIAKRFTVVH